jgi:hypothetical protein
MDMGKAAARMIQEYRDVLQDLGVLLLCARHPNRFFCNNPDCSNVVTASKGFLLVWARRVRVVGAWAAASGPCWHQPSAQEPGEGVYIRFALCWAVT